MKQAIAILLIFCLLVMVPAASYAGEPVPVEVDDHTWGDQAQMVTPEKPAHMILWDYIRNSWWILWVANERGRCVNYTNTREFHFGEHSSCESEQ